MIFFSDTQETASRFVDTIDDLQDVFRCHGVDFGSPEDFFVFARTVKYHSELRGDVMRVVKSVMEGETNISFRTMLTVIAVASGGLEVATSDREMSIPVQQVIESLTNVGACSQLNADQPDSPFSDLTANETVQVPAPPRSSSGSGQGTGRTVGPVVEKAASDPSIDQDPSNDYPSPSNDYGGGSNRLAESLTRLELNSLQMKTYIDSIDERISRMAPRVENVPSLVLSAPPSSYPREEAGARLSATIPSETEPQPQGSDSPGSNREARVGAGPLAALTRLWTDSQRFYVSRRQLPILVGVAMLLLASFLFSRFGRDTGDVVVHPVSASVEGGANTRGPSLAPRAGVAVSDAQVGAVSESHVTHVSDTSTAVSPVAGAQGNSSTLTQPPKKSAQIFVRSRLPSPSPAAGSTETTSEMATDTSETAASSVPSYKLSSPPLSGHLVNVSSGVMAANLVSGPKPSYPTLASLLRTQGNVVMQAVISKNGTVEHLQVIKGHRLLRGAAKSAVRTWKYRPYKVGGVPVEVATIVSVDFSLDR